jgi:hypothetical protein
LVSMVNLDLLAKLSEGDKESRQPYPDTIVFVPRESTVPRLGCVRESLAARASYAKLKQDCGGIAHGLRAHTRHRCVRRNIPGTHRRIDAGTSAAARSGTTLVLEFGAR